MTPIIMKRIAPVVAIPLLTVLVGGLFATQPSLAAEAENAPQKSEAKSPEAGKSPAEAKAPEAAKGPDSAKNAGAAKAPDAATRRKEMEAKIAENKVKFKAEQKLREDIQTNERQARSAVAEKKWPEAISFQREVVRLQPEERRAQYMLAIVLLQAKQPADAKPVLQKLAEKDDQFGANAKRMLVRIAADAK